MPSSDVLGLDDGATPVEHPVAEEVRGPTVMADPVLLMPSAAPATPTPIYSPLLLLLLVFLEIEDH